MNIISSLYLSSTESNKAPNVELIFPNLATWPSNMSNKPAKSIKAPAQPR